MFKKWNCQIKNAQMEFSKIQATTMKKLNKELLNWSDNLIQILVPPILFLPLSVPSIHKSQMALKKEFSCWPTDMQMIILELYRPLGMVAKTKKLPKFMLLVYLTIVIEILFLNVLKMAEEMLCLLRIMNCLWSKNLSYKLLVEQEFPHSMAVNFTLKVMARSKQHSGTINQEKSISIPKENSAICTKMKPRGFIQ